MKPFNKLSAQENEALLKFPAYISMLAAYSSDSLDETKKRLTIKFAHNKTYACDPLLREFYNEANTVFENTIETIGDEEKGE